MLERTMRRTSRRAIGIAAALACASAVAGETGPYAGQQDRAIATLSAADIAALRAGDGWGLAKPAELNGWPGPAHVLEMADALGLSAAQHRIVTRIHGLMRAEARRLGAKYIEAERALDAAFDDPTLDPAVLSGLIAASGNALGELRMIHLVAHVETRAVLTGAQIATYNRLRGYAGDGQGHAGHDGHGGHAEKGAKP